MSFKPKISFNFLSLIFYIFLSFILFNSFSFFTPNVFASESIDLTESYSSMKNYFDKESLKKSNAKILIDKLNEQGYQFIITTSELPYPHYINLYISPDNQPFGINYSSTRFNTKFTKPVYQINNTNYSDFVWENMTPENVDSLIQKFESEKGTTFPLSDGTEWLSDREINRIIIVYSSFNNDSINWFNSPNFILNHEIFKPTVPSFNQYYNNYFNTKTFIRSDYFQQISNLPIQDNPNYYTIRFTFNEKKLKDDGYNVYYQLSDFSKSAIKIFDSSLPYQAFYESQPYYANTDFTIYLVKSSDLETGSSTLVCNSFDTDSACFDLVEYSFNWSTPDFNSSLPYIKQVMTGGASQTDGFDVQVLLQNYNYIGYKIDSSDIVVTKNKQDYLLVPKVGFDKNITFYSCNDSQCLDIFDSREFTTPSLLDYINNTSTSSLFTNFSIEDFGLSNFILFPIKIADYVNFVSKNGICKPLSFPFLGSSIRFDCLSSVIPISFDNIIKIYQTILTFVLCYAIGIDFMRIVKNIQSPIGGKIEVIHL